MSREWLRTGLSTLAAFILALFAYGATAWVFGHFNTEPVYFDYLAEAFLQGRLDLPDPPGHHDLSPYQDRWYVPFPPLPALLMLPFVYAGGREAIDAVAMSIVLGSASVACVWAVLRVFAQRGWIELNASGRAAIVAFFALGTVHWYVAVTGSVWFLSQVSTVTFLALATWLAAASGNPLLSGSALALAMLARPNVLLGWPLLAGIAAMRAARQPMGSNSVNPRSSIQNSRMLKRWSVLSLIPPVIALAVLLAYNQARFDHPLDFGYTRQQVETSLMEPLHAHGQFSIDHVPRNLWYLLVEWPRPSRRDPRVLPSQAGMSALLTSPALLWLLTLRRRDPLVIGSSAAGLLTLASLLCYYNTGWVQFGYRFLLDLMLPLTILLAISAGRRIHWLFALLLIASVAVNAWGVWWWFTEVTTGG